LPTGTRIPFENITTMNYGFGDEAFLMPENGRVVWFPFSGIFPQTQTGMACTAPEKCCDNPDIS